MPIARLLQRFVEDELARTPSLAERTLQGVFERLRTAPDRELTVALQQRGSVFQATFVQSLRERVMAEMARQDGGSGMAPPSGLGGLALMDASRVEIDIEISRATQLIDTAADWELRELQTFTSALAGQSHVSAESNPLQPTIYAAALWDAGCALFGRQAQQAAVLRLAAPACAAHLKTAWAAASSRLEAQGVTPSLFRTVILPPSAAAMRQPAATPTSSTTHPPPVAADPMRSLLSTMPDHGGAPLAPAGRQRDDAVPAADRPEVAAALPADAGPTVDAALLRLDDTLRRVPAAPASPADAASWKRQVAERRLELAAQTRAHTGRQTIVLLSKVFDALLLDAQLHPALVASVARLQVSALKAGLHDPLAVVDSTHHPLWRLLDRLGEAGATYPAAADPRAVALGTLFHRLTDELNRTSLPDAAPFEKALARLDEFLSAQLQAQLRVAERSVEELRQAEKLETLQEQLAQGLIAQMQPLRPSAVVRRFVTASWSRVLATAMLKFGNDAPLTQDCIAVVDDLLWSVQTPDHPASRQRLAALLPGLMQRLRAGMALIALPHSEQRALLEELTRLHAAALRLDEPSANQPPSETQIVQQLADALGFAASTGEVRPNVDDGKPGSVARLIDGSSLETVPAELLDEHAPAAGSSASPQRQVAALRPAQRHRLFIHGRWARVQLLWRSEAGGFFLLAGEVAGQTHSLTRSALERLAEVQLLTPLEARTLTQRAVASVARQATVTAAMATMPKTTATA